MGGSPDDKRSPFHLLLPRSNATEPVADIAARIAASARRDAPAPALARTSLELPLVSLTRRAPDKITSQNPAAFLTSQADTALARFPDADVVVTSVLPRADPGADISRLGAAGFAPRWGRVDELAAALQLLLPAATAAEAPGANASSQPRGRDSAVVSCDGFFLVRAGSVPTQSLYHAASRAVQPCLRPLFFPHLAVPRVSACDPFRSRRRRRTLPGE